MQNVLVEALKHLREEHTRVIEGIEVLEGMLERRNGDRPKVNKQKRQAKQSKPKAHGGADPRNWTPAMRRAAAERMRKRMAAKKRLARAQNSPKIETAQAEVAEAN